MGGSTPGSRFPRVWERFVFERRAAESTTVGGGQGSVEETCSAGRDALGERLAEIVPGGNGRSLEKTYLDQQELPP